ncbi:MAG: glutathione S-transferase family protein [Gammaproteobacteria bacterium]|nr:glutathione S-transferase family protein [Gammaproteobacteria bacterium]
MITLYQFATSPFTEKVRRALNFKGIAFDVHEVARAKVGEGAYQDVSPTGKFPVIVDDGQAVWDSTDIIFHLERQHPGPNLVPSDPWEAAVAHAIEEWADESLYFYEMTMRLSWEHNLEAALDEFAESMPGVPKPQLKTMILNGVAQLTQAQGVGRKPRDQVVGDVERHLGALNALLKGRDWVVGDALSYADLAVIGQLNALLYAEEASAALSALQDSDEITPWMQRLDRIAPK